MNKKIFWLIIMVIGITSVVQAEDQLFFDSTAGVYFYAGIGGKIGWVHYGKNDKIGFIVDVAYYNNGFVGGDEGGGWREAIKIAHNFGIAAGVIFKNMGMNGNIRTYEYIQLKGVYSIWDKPGFSPYLDGGFKLNIFLMDKTALSFGVGLQTIMLPYFYLSLGMVFTL